MTQAIVNNLNNIQNGGFASEAKSSINNAFMDSDTSNDKVLSFSDIIDKIDCKQNYMLGSVNKEVSNGDMSEEIGKLIQFLTDATREANMENALDLTLAKDINEIIDQLKTACVSVDKDDNKANCDIKELQIITTDNTDIKEEGKEDSDPSIAVAFGQILKLLNYESTPLNNIENSTTEENTDSYLQEDKEILFKSTSKDYLKPETEDVFKETEIDMEMLDELQIESIETETDTSNENSFTNRQSPEEFGIKVMLNNTDKSGSGFETHIHTSSVKTQTVNADKLFDQITKQMNSMNGSSKVNIVLNPESLGKLNIQIMNTKEGLTAQFTVTTNEARELLMKGLDGLKENLITHGIGVDNISVKISEPEESSYNPDWTEQENSEQNQKGQQKQHREEKEKNLFEKTIEEKFGKKNGKV